MNTIILHGLGQSPEIWAKTISAMKMNNIHCPDLKEFCADSVTYQKMYRNTVKYVRSFSEPVNLCGLSLGAVIALQLVTDQPELIRKLALIAPQYEMPKKMLAFQNVLFKLMPDKAFTSMGFSKNEMIGLTMSMSRIDLRDGLDTINVPTLIINGEKDNANKKAAIELSRHIKGSRLVIASGAGHEVNIDSPECLGITLHNYFSK